eukprot:gb/GFBE01002036.1/.p1 GENE.gb/GFBE01002036.1/~~gb/GFBE01002036.1/.p1  ORF type:complete len:448 (+),score=95.72 gb/GFBE01002036.1/:1-1344(+)
MATRRCPMMIWQEAILLICSAFFISVSSFEVMAEAVWDDEWDSLSLLQRSSGRLLSYEDDAAQCSNSQPTQLFLDFDDTFKSSGGHWPSGCDGLYTKEVIYPGLAQFVLEIARGPSEAMEVLRPSVFSARPDGIDFLKVTDNSPQAMAMSAKQSPQDPAIWDQYNAEAKLQIPSDLRAYNYQDGGIRQILSNATDGGKFSLNAGGSKYGDVLDFFDFAKMGKTKFESFASFFAPGGAQGSGEACAVWLGDDGQGDCNPAAQDMRRFVKGGTKELALKVAFIHRLTCSNKPACQDAEAEEGAAPVIMFDTYLDAARSALQHGFISHGGFKRVEDAVTSFYAVYCHQDGSTRAPETLSDGACVQLRTAILKDGTEDSLVKPPVLQLRAEGRFEAFCSGCCSGDSPNGQSRFDFNGETFRCHNLYHTPSWWRLSLQASGYDCQTHCKEEA